MFLDDDPARYGGDRAVTYLLVFGLTSALAGFLFIFRVRPHLAVILISLILASFAALRGSDVASDFIVYQDWYSSRDLGNGLLERPGFFEALYFLLNDFFSAIDIPFRVFVWLLAFMAVFIKTKVIISFAKSGWAVGVGMLIYLFTFYLLHDFTQIRAGLAIAFIFLAVRALVDGDRAHFVLLVVLAAGFHSSAVMAFLLLLPYRSSRARWVDWGLFVISSVVFALATRGVVVGAALVDVLAKFDPRLALYISSADSGQSEAANPFSVSALLLLALAFSLIGVEFNRWQISNSDERDVYAIVLARRSILIGLIFLASLSPIPELALRLFEINIALLPIIATIVFSRQGWVLQKFLLFLWGGALAFIYIARDEGLVQPYVLFFS